MTSRDMCNCHFGVLLAWGGAVEAAMRYRVKDTPQKATVISVSNTQGH